MKNSSNFINSLKPNEIFVFGSNLSGKHGKYAAKQAIQWGAKWGQAVGISGQTYAIPTKDHDYRKTLPLKEIKDHILAFIAIAEVFSELHPEKVFLVTQIGCGSAGYTPEQIAPFFKDALKSSNVLLPKSFTDILKPYLESYLTNENI